MYDFRKKGMLAVKVPIHAVRTFFNCTRSEIILYLVLLFCSNRGDGKIKRNTVSDINRLTGLSKSAIYTAHEALNEKGLIASRIDGYIRGEVKVRYKRPTSTDEDEQLQFKIEEGFSTLDNALLHRGALQIFSSESVSRCAILTYLWWSANCDLESAQIHEKRIKDAAETLGYQRAAIYTALNELNAAGLANIKVRIDATGNMPHVGCAHGELKIAVERKKAENKRDTSTKAKLERYRRGLYRLFGVAIDLLKPTDVTKCIADLKDHLDSRLGINEDFGGDPQWTLAHSS